ncbi:MAG: hypothetical protein NZ901_00045 [Geminocystis sp.]|nr:hypothetical protein [Geminocystis sp.]MCX8078633.1 hypothetical protein [Geminocystis sp.]MDW8117323.1 hypothetical protein [Geminocystis sp.]HIK38816.1 hypothetical protein [Geminocystis sp. M7585_C2015_104]
MALIFGGLVDNSTALTPTYIKIIKDIVFILLGLGGFVGILRRNRVNRYGLMGLLYFLLVVFTALAYSNNFLIFLAGLRWTFPVLLITFLIPYITKDFLVKIANMLFGLFLLHFLFQIIQLFFAQGWFGRNALGLSLRNPGIFFIPSTAAFFTICVLFFTMFYQPNRVLRRFIFWLSPLSIFLTASGSGVVVYPVIMTIYLVSKKFFKLLPIVVVILLFLAGHTVQDITGRDKVLEGSFATRIEIFVELIKQASLISQNFGYGTNTGVLLANQLGLDLGAVITDSTYASIIANLGLLGLIITLVIVLIFATIAWLNKDKEKLVFVAIFGLFSATTNIVEAFPMNLLFSILVAYYLKNSKS